MGVKKCSYKDIELIPTQESKHCWGGGMICRAAVHSPGTTWVRSWTLDSPSSSLSIFPTKRSGEDLELTTQSHGPLSHGFYSFAPEQSMSTYEHCVLLCMWISVAVLTKIYCLTLIGHFYPWSLLGHHQCAVHWLAVPAFLPVLFSFVARYARSVSIYIRLLRVQRMCRHLVGINCCQCCRTKNGTAHK